MKLAVRILIAINILTITIVILSLIPVSGINREISPYYEYAMKIVRENCKEGEYNNPKYIKVGFSNKLSSEVAIGECLNLYFRYEITIKKSYWDDVEDRDRYSLIMHEVAHCALGMPHSEDEGNYMYFQDNFLELETVTNQFRNDAMAHCSNNRK